MYKFSFIVVLIAIISFTTSCTDDNDLLESEDQTLELPTNQSETLELIVRKWNLSDSEEFNSLEFTANNEFIITKTILAGSTEAAQQTIRGTFEISEDGLEVTLINFGVINILEVRERSMIFSLTKNSGTSLGNILAQKIEKIRLISPVDGTKFNKWPRTTNFDWEGLKGISEYKIEVTRHDFDFGPNWTSIDFSETVNSKSTTLEMPGMVTDGNYYSWKVMVTDKDGNITHESDSWKFEYLQ